MPKNSLEQFKIWHKSKAGLAIFGVLELGLAYIVASRALDTGSLWQYALGLLLVIGGVQNIVRLIGKILSGKANPTRLS